MGRKLKINDNFLKDLANVVVEMFKDSSDYQYLEKHRDQILDNIDQEEIKFRKTLNNGLKEFEKLAEGKKDISGERSFLYL